MLRPRRRRWTGRACPRALGKSLPTSHHQLGLLDNSGLVGKTSPSKLKAAFLSERERPFLFSGAPSILPAWGATTASCAPARCWLTHPCSPDPHKLTGSGVATGSILEMGSRHREDGDLAQYMSRLRAGQTKAGFSVLLQGCLLVVGQAWGCSPPQLDIIQH